jgi:hypothetical protein
MTDRLARGREYVYRNARLLERYQFACLFDRGDADTVVRAAQAYQNEDGGFGNAIEPDMRGPHSQPLAVDMAFRILDSIGRLNGETAGAALDWCHSVTAPDGGIPWVLPVVAEYAHAPWWQPADPPEGSVGATGSILHMALKNRIDHPLIPPCLDFLRSRLADPQEADLEFHMIRPAVEALALTGDDSDGTLAEKAGALIRERGLIAATEQAKDEPYAHTPLHWASRPDSAWRRLLSDEEIARDLDALTVRQEDDGSWPLGFPLTSPAAEFEWRGAFTIRALVTLQAFGKLP